MPPTVDSARPRSSSETVRRVLAAAVFLPIFYYLVHDLGPIAFLGLAAIADAAFDISDLDNTPLAAIRTTGSTQTALYLVDLVSGRAQRIGRIDDGSPIVGLAIEP